MPTDPIARFHRWYTQARRARILQPDAMTLATAGTRGRPSARMVLLKQADADGFIFYTNGKSRKGRELGLKPLTIAVLDAGGHLLAFARQDGSSTLRPQIAMAKASGALGLGVSSRQIGEMAEARPQFVAALQGSVAAISCSLVEPSALRHFAEVLQRILWPVDVALAFLANPDGVVPNHSLHLRDLRFGAERLAWKFVPWPRGEDQQFDRDRF